MSFPPVLLGNVVAWLDGNQIAYADSAGTSISSAFRAPVRRVNEASPLTGNWQSVDDAHRPYRDTQGIRFDQDAPASLVRSASAPVSTRDSAIALSFLLRGGESVAQGLIRATTTGSHYGLLAYVGILAVLGPGGYQYPLTNIPIPRAQRVSLIARYTSSGLIVRVSTGEVVADYVTGLTFPSESTTSPLTIGYSYLTTGVYGTFAQALVLNRSPTDLETTDLMTWLDAQPLTGAAFPTDSPLLSVSGDSIMAFMWSYPSVTTVLRATYPTLEVFDVGIPGDYSSGLAAQRATAAQQYSALRSRNVDVIAVGTNDLAAGISPATIAANIFADADARRAAGKRVAIAGVLPRTVPGAQAAFNTGRATLNNLLAAGAPSHSDTNFIDVRTLSGMGADGDSDGPTYYVDQVHPNAAGFAYMATIYQPAIAVMLSPDAVMLDQSAGSRGGSPGWGALSFPRSVVTVTD